MIQIPYKCACMPAEAIVEVRYRNQGEDMLAYMEIVVGTIGADHRKRSPLCQAQAMEYAKLPAPENAPFIGGKPIVN